MIETIDKNNIPLGDWAQYRKKTLTKSRRMPGSFKIKTREGELVCEDGYICIDAHGYPYPVAKEEFEQIYELVDE